MCTFSAADVEKLRQKQRAASFFQLLDLFHFRISRCYDLEILQQPFRLSPLVAIIRLTSTASGRVPRSDALLGRLNKYDNHEASDKQKKMAEWNSGPAMNPQECTVSAGLLFDLY